MGNRPWYEIFRCQEVCGELSGDDVFVFEPVDTRQRQVRGDILNDVFVPKPVDTRQKDVRREIKTLWGTR